MAWLCGIAGKFGFILVFILRESSTKNSHFFEKIEIFSGNITQCVMFFLTIGFPNSGYKIFKLLSKEQPSRSWSFFGTYSSSARLHLGLSVVSEIEDL